MIDLSRTRAELLAEIGAPLDAAAPLTHIGDPGLLDSDARLLLRGHTRQELFPILEAALTERFAAVSRSQLVGDLLVPLWSALGNAYKRGNRGDAGKSISVDTVLTRKGALVSVTDDGEGFDVFHVLRQLRNREPVFVHRGAGFTRFERSASLVTYDDGGRTLLICFLAQAETQEACTAARGGRQDATTDDSLHSLEQESVPRNATTFDHAWLRSRLSVGLPEVAQRRVKLESCRAYVTDDLGDDHRGVRIILRVSSDDGGPHETRILTGRLHVDDAAAETDFAAATKLHRELELKSVRIPGPLLQLAGDPRLVLYDLHPWMSLWEYFADRGTPKVLRARSERVGRALGMLHRSGIAFEKVEPDLLGERFRGVCARVSDRLEAVGAGAASLGHRFCLLQQRIEEQAASHRPRPAAPIHGRFGFDCVQYGVDGSFNLYGFEACRLGSPGLDVGGFLADLRLLASIEGDEEIHRAGCEAFLAGYSAGEGHSMSRAELGLYAARALVDRMDRPNHRTGCGVDSLLREAERSMEGID